MKGRKVKPKLTTTRKKTLEKFKIRYNALNRRVIKRNLRAPEIFRAADVIFDNIRELEKTLFNQTAAEVAELAAGLDRRFGVLESFVAKTKRVEQTRRKR